MKTGIIYIIKNFVNTKVYIGQTTSDVQTRFKQHLKKSILSLRHYKIYNAIKKYGKDKFYIEVLEKNIPVEKLDEREIYYIELYNSFECGYNSSKGGDGRVINKSYDEQKIINSYLSGRSLNQICKDYNVSTATISRVLKRLKIETRHDGNKYESINIETFASEWYNKNVSIHDMALKYNVDEKTIRRYSIRFGLKRKGTNMNCSNLEIQIILWNQDQNDHTKIESFAFNDIDDCSSFFNKIKDKKIMILIG